MNLEIKPITVNGPQDILELQKECLRIVKFYVDKAKEKLSVCIPYPTVRFDLKGTTAGMAYAGKNLIRFQPLLLRENASDFLEKTTGHEVAHLVARAKFGAIDPHGKEWKRVMWAFCLPAKRCHNYDLASIRGGSRIVKPSTTIKTNIGLTRVGSGIKVTELD
jgi:predicted SprT family Zn-dependent metalloprotease